MNDSDKFYSKTLRQKVKNLYMENKYKYTEDELKELREILKDKFDELNTDPLSVSEKVEKMQNSMRNYDLHLKIKRILKNKCVYCGKENEHDEKSAYEEVCYDCAVIHLLNKNG
jgi:hypothetical protein